jgi:hypothetical protein
MMSGAIESGMQHAFTAWWEGNVTPGQGKGDSGRPPADGKRKIRSRNEDRISAADATTRTGSPALKLIEGGMSLRQAAKVLGVSVMTVSRDVTESVTKCDTRTGSPETRARRAAVAARASAEGAR